MLGREGDGARGHTASELEEGDNRTSESDTTCKHKVSLESTLVADEIREGLAD